MRVGRSCLVLVHPCTYLPILYTLFVFKCLRLDPVHPPILGVYTLARFPQGCIRVVVRAGVNLVPRPCRQLTSFYQSPRVFSCRSAAPTVVSCFLTGLCSSTYSQDLRIVAPILSLSSPVHLTVQVVYCLFSYLRRKSPRPSSALTLASTSAVHVHSTITDSPIFANLVSCVSSLSPPEVLVHSMELT